MASTIIRNPSMMFWKMMIRHSAFSFLVKPSRV
jgi:hypothetical protein